MRKLTRKAAKVNGRPSGYISLVPVRYRCGTGRVFDLSMPLHTRRCLATLPELADRHPGTGGCESGNYNPDTGREESASRDHETTRNVLQRLGWAA